MSECDRCKLLDELVVEQMLEIKQLQNSLASRGSPPMWTAERDRLIEALRKIANMFKEYPPTTDIEYMTTGIAIEALKGWDE